MPNAFQLCLCRLGILGQVVALVSGVQSVGRLLFAKGQGGAVLQTARQIFMELSDVVIGFCNGGLICRNGLGSHLGHGAQRQAVQCRSPLGGGFQAIQTGELRLCRIAG